MHVEEERDHAWCTWKERETMSGARGRRERPCLVHVDGKRDHVWCTWKKREIMPGARERKERHARTHARTHTHACTLTHAQKRVKTLSLKDIQRKSGAQTFW